jgi:hypothetical protein
MFPLNFDFKTVLQGQFEHHALAWAGRELDRTHCENNPFIFEAQKRNKNAFASSRCFCRPYRPPNPAKSIASCSFPKDYSYENYLIDGFDLLAKTANHQTYSERNSALILL